MLKYALMLLECIILLSICKAFVLPSSRWAVDAGTSSNISAAISITSHPSTLILYPLGLDKPPHRMTTKCWF